MIYNKNEKECWASIATLPSQVKPIKDHNREGVNESDFKFTLPIVVTINNGNPIVIITFLSFLCNVVLSLISLKFKKVLIIKIINYILFVVNIFLAFFSIIAAYALVNSKVY